MLTPITPQQRQEREEANTLKRIRVLLGECRNCNGQGEEDHQCPYQADVNSDITFRCNCCDACRSNCADDI